MVDLLAPGVAHLGLLPGLLAPRREAALSLERGQWCGGGDRRGLLAHNVLRGQAQGGQRNTTENKKRKR